MSGWKWIGQHPGICYNLALQFPKKLISPELGLLISQHTGLHETEITDVPNSGRLTGRDNVKLTTTTPPLLKDQVRGMIFREDCLRYISLSPPQIALNIHMDHTK